MRSALPLCPAYVGRGRAVIGAVSSVSPLGTDLILTCVRWDVVSLESSRQREERLQERRVTVTPAPMNHWLPQESLPLAEVFHRRKHLVWIR